MKTITTFTLALILPMAIVFQAKSQNCYLEADYNAQGLTLSFTAQLYENEANSQDSTMVPVTAQYIWNIGNQSFSGQQIVFQFASAGNYMVTVTGSSVLNCTASQTLWVYVSDGNPVDSTGYFNVYISGDYYAGQNCEANLSAYVMGGNAPFSYEWNNSATGSLLTGLCAGEYCVTVTDAEGFAASSCFTVYEGINTEPGDTTGYNNIYLVLSYVFESPDACSATATATVFGGIAPYTYLWNNGQTTAAATGLCDGETACLTVLDAAGNASTACVFVSIENTIPYDSILNDNDPWATTIVWDVDSMFNTAQIIDYWVTNTEICFVWAMIYENSSYTETFTVCYPIDAATIVDGYYLVYLHVVFNNSQKANYTFSDVVFAQVSAFLNMANAVAKPRLILYPNPVSDVLTIEGVNGTSTLSIRVYNMAGICVDSYSFNRVSGAIQLNATNWNQGVYFIEIVDGTNRQTFRIVK